MKPTAKVQILMYSNFILFSLTSVASRYASFFELISLPAVALYALSFGLLGVYAILWQQVLRVTPLSYAYLAKAVTIPLGVFWGWLLFAERLTPTMLAGVGIVIVGVLLLSSPESEPAKGGA